MSIINVDFAPLQLISKLRSDHFTGWKIAESDEYSYLWQKGPCFNLDGISGEDAAEEVYEIYNNPNRLDDKWRLFLSGSIDVGDIVTVDGVSFYCAHFGWTKLYDRNSN